MQTQWRMMGKYEEKKTSWTNMKGEKRLKVKRRLQFVLYDRKGGGDANAHRGRRSRWILLQGPPLLLRTLSTRSVADEATAETSRRQNVQWSRADIDQPPPPRRVLGSCCQISTATLTAVPFDHPQSKGPNVKH
ncbi:hypothetical protein EYF80_004521 [Liparis tanakae]|uniref:Uncharacterized protein n=1 Tax=Liparis tanakae TaxID=230148 RepID=A0A4Z2J5G4_9TELE|nr:hypothetical protein EYF80_004521 [Liparis tanakae]